MPRALRDFRYFDYEKGASVQVRQGDAVDAEVLGRHRVDIAKLGRTKHVDLTTEGEPHAPELVVKRRPGRPRKIS